MPEELDQVFLLGCSLVVAASVLWVAAAFLLLWLDNRRQKRLERLAAKWVTSERLKMLQFPSSEEWEQQDQERDGTEF